MRMRGWGMIGGRVRRFTGMMIGTPRNFHTALQIFLNNVFLGFKMAELLQEIFVLNFKLLQRLKKKREFFRKKKKKQLWLLTPFPLRAKISFNLTIRCYLIV